MYVVCRRTTAGGPILSTGSFVIARATLVRDFKSQNPNLRQILPRSLFRLPISTSRVILLKPAAPAPAPAAPVANAPAAADAALGVAPVLPQLMALPDETTLGSHLPPGSNILYLTVEVLPPAPFQLVPRLVNAFHATKPWLVWAGILLLIALLIPLLLSLLPGPIPGSEPALSDLGQCRALSPAERTHRFLEDQLRPRKWYTPKIPHPCDAVLKNAARYCHSESYLKTRTKSPENAVRAINAHLWLQLHLDEIQKCLMPESIKSDVSSIPSCLDRQKQFTAVSSVEFISHQLHHLRGSSLLDSAVFAQEKPSLLALIEAIGDAIALPHRMDTKRALEQAKLLQSHLLPFDDQLYTFHELKHLLTAEQIGSKVVWLLLAASQTGKTLWLHWIGGTRFCWVEVFGGGQVNASYWTLTPDHIAHPALVQAMVGRTMDSTTGTNYIVPFDFNNPGSSSRGGTDYVMDGVGWGDTGSEEVDSAARIATIDLVRGSKGVRPLVFVKCSLLSKDIGTAEELRLLIDRWSSMYSDPLEHVTTIHIVWAFCSKDPVEQREIRGRIDTLATKAESDPAPGAKVRAAFLRHLLKTDMSVSFDPTTSPDETTQWLASVQVGNTSVHPQSPAAFRPAISEKSQHLLSKHLQQQTLLLLDDSMPLCNATEFEAQQERLAEIIKFARRTQLQEVVDLKVRAATQADSAVRNALKDVVQHLLSGQSSSDSIKQGTHASAAIRLGPRLLLGDVFHKSDDKDLAFASTSTNFHNELIGVGTKIVHLIGKFVGKYSKIVFEGPYGEEVKEEAKQLSAQVSTAINFLHVLVKEIKQFSASCPILHLQEVMTSLHKSEVAIESHFMFLHSQLRETGTEATMRRPCSSWDGTFFSVWLLQHLRLALPVASAILEQIRSTAESLTATVRTQLKVDVERCASVVTTDVHLSIDTLQQWKADAELHNKCATSAANWLGDNLLPTNQEKSAADLNPWEFITLYNTHAYDRAKQLERTCSDTIASNNPRFMRDLKSPVTSLIRLSDTVRSVPLIEIKADVILKVEQVLQSAQQEVDGGLKNLKLHGDSSSRDLWAVVSHGLVILGDAVWFRATKADALTEIIETFDHAAVSINQSALATRWDPQDTHSNERKFRNGINDVAILGTIVQMDIRDVLPKFGKLAVEIAKAFNDNVIQPAITYLATHYTLEEVSDSANKAKLRSLQTHRDQYELKSHANQLLREWNLNELQLNHTIQRLRSEIANEEADFPARFQQLQTSFKKFSQLQVSYSSLIGDPIAAKKLLQDAEFEDAQELADSIAEVHGQLQNAQAEHTSMLQNLQSDLISALQRLQQYEEALLRTEPSAEQVEFLASLGHSLESLLSALDQQQKIVDQHEQTRQSHIFPKLRPHEANRALSYLNHATRTLEKAGFGDDFLQLRSMRDKMRNYLIEYYSRSSRIMHQHLQFFELLTSDDDALQAHRDAIGPRGREFCERFNELSEVVDSNFLTPKLKRLIEKVGMPGFNFERAWKKLFEAHIQTLNTRIVACHTDLTRLELLRAIPQALRLVHPGYSEAFNSIQSYIAGIASQNDQVMISAITSNNFKQIRFQWDNVLNAGGDPANALVSYKPKLNYTVEAALENLHALVAKFGSEISGTGDLVVTPKLKDSLSLVSLMNVTLPELLRHPKEEGIGLFSLEELAWLRHQLESASQEVVTVLEDHNNIVDNIKNDEYQLAHFDVARRVAACEVLHSPYCSQEVKTKLAQRRLEIERRASQSVASLENKTLDTVEVDWPSFLYSKLHHKDLDDMQTYLTLRAKLKVRFKSMCKNSIEEALLSKDPVAMLETCEQKASMVLPEGQASQQCRDQITSEKNKYQHAFQTNIDAFTKALQHPTTAGDALSIYLKAEKELDPILPQLQKAVSAQAQEWLKRCNEWFSNLLQRMEHDLQQAVNVFKEFVSGTTQLYFLGRAFPKINDVLQAAQHGFARYVEAYQEQMQLIEQNLKTEESNSKSSAPGLAVVHTGIVLQRAFANEPCPTDLQPFSPTETDSKLFRDCLPVSAAEKFSKLSARFYKSVREFLEGKQKWIDVAMSPKKLQVEAIANALQLSWVFRPTYEQLLLQVAAAQRWMATWDLRRTEALAPTEEERQELKDLITVVEYKVHTDDGSSPEAISGAFAYPRLLESVCKLVQNAKSAVNAHFNEDIPPPDLLANSIASLAPSVTLIHKLGSSRSLYDRLTNEVTGCDTRFEFHESDFGVQAKMSRRFQACTKKMQESKEPSEELRQCDAYIAAIASIESLAPSANSARDHFQEAADARIKALTSQAAQLPYDETNEARALSDVLVTMRMYSDSFSWLTTSIENNIEIIVDEQLVVAEEWSRKNNGREQQLLRRLNHQFKKVQSDRENGFLGISGERAKAAGGLQRTLPQLKQYRIESRNQRTQAMTVAAVLDAITGTAFSNDLASYARRDLTSKYERVKQTFDQLIDTHFGDRELKALIEQTKQLPSKCKQVRTQKPSGSWLSWLPGGTAQPSVKDWYEPCADVVPELLAHLFAYWSLHHSNGPKSATKSKPVILEPHPAQVIALLRMFGHGYEKPTPELQSTMLEVLTGEGKSVIISTASALLALFGADVNVVCYSQVLTDRDAMDFVWLFEGLGLRSQVRYITSVQLAQRAVDRYGDLRTMARDLLTTGQLSSNVGMGSSIVGWPVFAIMDEFDYAFEEEFFESAYRPMASIAGPTITEMVHYLWLHKDELRNLGWASVQKLAVVQAVQIAYPHLKELLFEQVKLLLIDLYLFDQPAYHQYEVREKRICYREHHGYTCERTVRYMTLWAAIKARNTLDRSEFDDSSVTEHMSLTIHCGEFAFAEMPKQFDGIFGFTGTLKTLTPWEREITKNEYGVERYTYVPSSYGPSKRTPLNANNLVLTNNANFALELVNAIKRGLEGQPQAGAAKADRVVFVAVRDQAEVDAFQLTGEWISFRQQHTGGVRTLSEETPIGERANILSWSSQSGSILFMTTPYLRGTDSIIEDPAVVANGGAVLIKTYWSRSLATAVQEDGRIGRQAQGGTVMAVLKLEELEAFSLDQSKIDEAKNKGKKLVELLEEARAELAVADGANRNEVLQLMKLKHERSLACSQHIRKGDLASTYACLLNTAGNRAFGSWHRARKVCRMVVAFDGTLSMGSVHGQVRNQWQHFMPVIREIMILNGKDPNALFMQFQVYRNYPQCKETEVVVSSAWEQEPANLRKFMEDNQPACGYGEEAMELAFRNIAQNCENDPDTAPTQIFIVADREPNSLEEVKRRRALDGRESSWSQLLGPPTDWIEQQGRIRSSPACATVPVHMLRVQPVHQTPALQQQVQSAFEHIASSFGHGSTAQYLDVHADTQAVAMQLAERIFADIGDSVQERDDMIRLFREKTGYKQKP